VKSAIFVGSKCHGFQKIKNKKSIVTTWICGFQNLSQLASPTTCICIPGIVILFFSLPMKSMNNMSTAIIMITQCEIITSYLFICINILLNGRNFETHQCIYVTVNLFVHCYFCMTTSIAIDIL